MASWIEEVSESDSRTSYAVSSVISRVDTACCAVIIAESDVYGRLLFLDGELQSAEKDEHIYHESLVHPVMAGLARSGYHHDDGLHVLVVGGGEGATVREVVKWAPERVDWIDIDGELVDLCERELGWAPGIRGHQAVRYQAADIRVALPELGLYDAIILDLPDPDGDTGYLYSEEFWASIRDHLAPGGRLVTHCGPVRPFDSIGGGFQRVRSVVAIPFDIQGFYSQSIPSFQGEWGFWMWAGEGVDPFAFAREANMYIAERPRVADEAQMRTWGAKSLVWQSALHY